MYGLEKASNVDMGINRMRWDGKRPSNRVAFSRHDFNMIPYELLSSDLYIYMYNDTPDRNFHINLLRNYK